MPTKSTLQNIFFDLFMVTLSYAIALQFAPAFALWTPVTVLVILQPTKGMTYHLGLQRLIGTVLGSLLAVILIKFLPPTPWLVVCVLTLIVSIAAGLSCLGRSINGYMFQSTGFTTAIVYLLSMAHPGEAMNYPLVRITGIFIGIFVVLLGMNFIKKESERAKLDLATMDVKRLIREWARLVLQIGTSPESIKLREEIVRLTNSLNDLSSYASSQRFFFGSSRRNTVHFMGTVYTIISLTRAKARKLDHVKERSHITEETYPEIAQKFQELDVHPAKLSIDIPLNWDGAMKSFFRTLTAGTAAGFFWLLSGLPGTVTFFMVTLVHCCVFSTNHRAVEKVKLVLRGLIGAVLVVMSLFTLFGSLPILDLPHFLILLLPGILISVTTGKAALGSVIMLFSLILYSASASHGSELTYFHIFVEYAAFSMGLLFSLLLTLHLLPLMADRRYHFYRYRLFLEARRVTDLQNPLTPDWMHRMYSYMEGMLSYATDIRMDEAMIMNEGLVAIDVCVEVLEIRSQVPSKELELRAKLMEAISMITEAKLPLDVRCGKLNQVADELEGVEGTLSHNLRIIAKKMNQAKSLFEMRVQ